MDSVTMSISIVVPISFSKKQFCYVLCTCWTFRSILLIFYALSCWYELNIGFTSSKWLKWTNGSWCLNKGPKCSEFLKNGVYVDVTTMYLCYLSHMKVRKTQEGGLNCVGFFFFLSYWSHWSEAVRIQRL